MSEVKKKTDDSLSKEIVTTRILNFPREHVFKAWENPLHLARWWGPKGFTNTFQEFNMQPGGTWDFVMHGPDGTNYKNKSVFVEIVKPEKIEFCHVSGPVFRVQVTFEAMPDKYKTMVMAKRRTKIIFRMIFDSVEECQKVKQYAVNANEQNLDKLEMLLKNVNLFSEDKK